jgi:hypothetical protein
MALKKLLAKNDEADPQFVLPITFLSIFLGFVFTGTAIVLSTQSEQRVAFEVFSVLAALSWASLALLWRKYSRITM